MSITIPNKKNFTEFDWKVFNIIDAKMALHKQIAPQTTIFFVSASHKDISDQHTVKCKPFLAFLASPS